MSLIKRFIQKSRQEGIAEAIKLSGIHVKRRFIKIGSSISNIFTFAGRISNLEEEVESLYYYLDNFVDITKIPHASGVQRKFQLCDVILLNIFHEICRKQKWTYFLTDGTLLGAFRHKGFVPWDDDIDVCMPREQYNEAFYKLPEILASYGKDSPLMSLQDTWQISLNSPYNRKDGINLDIYPVDTVYADIDSPELFYRINQYRKFYLNTGRNLSPEELNVASNEILNPKNSGGGGGGQN